VARLVVSSSVVGELGGEVFGLGEGQRASLRCWIAPPNGQPRRLHSQWTIADNGLEDGDVVIVGDSPHVDAIDVVKWLRATVRLHLVAVPPTGADVRWDDGHLSCRVGRGATVESVAEWVGKNHSPPVPAGRIAMAVPLSLHPSVWNSPDGSHKLDAWRPLGSLGRHRNIGGFDIDPMNHTVIRYHVISQLTIYVFDRSTARTLSLDVPVVDPTLSLAAAAVAAALQRGISAPDGAEGCVLTAVDRVFGTDVSRETVGEWLARSSPLVLEWKPVGAAGIVGVHDGSGDRAMGEACAVRHVDKSGGVFGTPFLVATSLDTTDDEVRVAVAAALSLLPADVAMWEVARGDLGFAVRHTPSSWADAQSAITPARPSPAKRSRTTPAPAMTIKGT